MATFNETSSPLDIPELLGMTLSYLPADDIARSRRTSKFWRNVIDSTGDIKTALFFKPVKTFETFEWAKHPTTGKHEPRIQQKVRPLSEMKAQPQKYPIVTFHPILLNARSACDDIYKFGTHIYFDLDKIHALKPGKWLDMLISQPPLQEMGIGHDTFRRGIDYAKEGITFRDLLRS